MAHLQTQATKGNDQERYAAKFRLVKLLYERGYVRQDILELLRFIDWVLTLPKALEQQFREDVTTLETEMAMEYVTSFERLAREEGIEEGMQKGIEEGMQKGIQQGILTVLEARFGAVPEQVMTTVGKIEDVDVLRDLQREAAVSPSIDDFMQTLPDQQ